MKKILALVLTLAMVLSLAACGAGAAPAESAAEAAGSAAASAAEEAAAPAADGAKTVGIAMPTKSLERWNRDGDYLKAQFEAAGYAVELKYSDNDTDQQNNDIQAMIADKVDLLIIAAIDGDSLSQTLADAKSAGIPVIAYDRLIMNTDAVSYYVSFDNYTVGVLQGEFVKNALDLDNAAGPFNIEFTAGDPADNNAGYFFNGAYDNPEALHRRRQAGHPVRQDHLRAGRYSQLVHRHRPGEHAEHSGFLLLRRHRSGRGSVLQRLHRSGRCSGHHL